MTGRNHAFRLISLPLCATALSSFILLQPAPGIAVGLDNPPTSPLGHLVQLAHLVLDGLAISGDSHVESQLAS
jgi:hypothetical protein